ncbi:hypothetical protein BD408DRAFT_406958 [Parasitella parasitica]|nr:hypothetical protein BD408DRAFT_406958 [Parasitella parasitica]
MCSFDGSLAVVLTVSSDNVSTNSSSVTSPILDALRMDIIRAKLESQNLSAQAAEDLLAERLADNATNQQYRRFTPSDVVNFLASMRQEHNMQASTLKTLRAAVVYLHDDTTGISKDRLIHSYLDTIAKQAPPVSIHRPFIDASPALANTRFIASRSSTNIKLLQQKLAFLLPMAAFLRPSDLVRIPVTCSISENGCLLLKVVAPKELVVKETNNQAFLDSPTGRRLRIMPCTVLKGTSRPSGSTGSPNPLQTVCQI